MNKKDELLLAKLVEKNLSRRDFIRYSSVALSAATVPGMISCARVEPKQDCLEQVLLGRNRNHAKVFEPTNLAGIALENRIIRSATTLALADEDGRPTQDLADAYAELGEGGIGMIITGFASVQPNGLPGARGALLFHRDDYIPDYQMLVEAAHKQNTPIVLQIGHSGRQTRRAVTGYQPVAPSPIAAKHYDEEDPKQLTDMEIQELIKAYIATVERARQAGFDGAQLHGAHGYMLCQFLSGESNQREDRWGGSLENRFRIIREIYTGARAKVGDYPIFIKLSAYDFQTDGLRVEETVEIAKMLQEVGCDGIEVSCGVMNDGFSTIRVPEIPTEAVLRYNYKYKDKNAMVKGLLPVLAPLMVGRPEPIINFNVCAAQEIKQAVDIPVIAVGGIRKLPDIEQIIGGGMADYVALGRPLIIEPDIVNKFKAQSQNESSCINCGYCIIALAEEPARCFYGELS